jgi:hypothetical protein
MRTALNARPNSGPVDFGWGFLATASRPVAGHAFGREGSWRGLALLLGALLSAGPCSLSGQDADLLDADAGADEAFTVKVDFLPDPNPPTETHRVLQPVHQYQNVQDPQGRGRQRIQQKMNPFLAYTHLGTDFGFIGAGEDGLGWEVGTVCVSMPPGYWGGMWHSLAGLGDDEDLTLDFRACYPAPIKSKYQPQIVGLELAARGKGVIKVEIKSVHQEILWFRNVEIDSPDLRTTSVPLNPVEIGSAKFLNWVAESGTDACLNSVNFVVKTPDVPYDEYVFLSSYAKLARCFSPATGLARDRAHVRAGSFDNIPATGLYALGTTLASRLGMVDDAYARDTLRKIFGVVEKLPKAFGLLPHFTRRRDDGTQVILPGTEFSVVDTSIYYHSMLLAAEILGDKALVRDVAQAVHRIALGDLVDSAGFIRHGLREDGTTPLPGVWRDWGGETALVLALAAMTEQPPQLRMEPGGRIPDGTGFIAEVQSMFYPDFDNPRPDAVTGQDWPKIRLALLEKQKDYFPKFWPDSKAAQLGLYGLSAGEARYGMGYSVGGANLPNQTLIHPHYILIAGALAPNPNEVHDLLRRMEDQHLFPPWGMVENVNKDLTLYLPMQGALNAGFETVGAYHLLVKHRGIKDEIFEASRADLDLRKAAGVFYPPETSSFAGGSNVGSPLSAR